MTGVGDDSRGEVKQVAIESSCPSMKVDEKGRILSSYNPGYAEEAAGLLDRVSESTGESFPEIRRIHCHKGSYAIWLGMVVSSKRAERIREILESEPLDEFEDGEAGYLAIGDLAFYLVDGRKLFDPDYSRYSDYPFRWPMGIEHMRDARG